MASSKKKTRAARLAVAMSAGYIYNVQTGFEIVMLATMACFANYKSAMNALKEHETQFIPVNSDVPYYVAAFTRRISREYRDAPFALISFIAQTAA